MELKNANESDRPRARDQQRIEEALRDSQTRLAGVIDSAMDAIITVDGDQRILVFNHAAEKMFRCLAAEAIGQPLERFIPKRFHAAHREHVENFGRTHVTRRSMGSLGAIFGLRADGEDFPIEASISQLESAGRKFYTVILRDITERKQSELAAARLAAIVESSSDAIVGKDLHSNVTSWNAGAERMFGYAASQMVGQSITRIIPTDHRDDEEKILARIRRGESVEHFETQRIHKDGKLIDVSVTVSPIKDAEGQVVGASKVARDITERKRAEAKIRALNADLERRVEERTAALHASEARYRLLFDSIDEGFCIIEMIFDEQQKPVDYRFLEVNPAFERQTGLRDAVGKRMRELAPRHEEHWFETYGRIAVTGEAARFQNHAKELHHWYDVYACRFGEPKNLQVAIVFGDITGRKVAEANIMQLNAELQQRAAELNSLFESLPGLYLVLTPDLKIVSASDAYLKATMTTREGILGRNLFQAFPDNPDDPGTTAVSNMRASIERVIENAAPDTMAIQRHDVRRPDGVFEERYWSPINSPMFGADRQIKYIVHRVEEVTEFVRQKSQSSGSTVELSARVQQMEAEVFRSSQKLQAANQQLEAANKELEAFSYSVSHDLRAPLRHINGFSQTLLEDYADKLDEEGKGYLHEVRAASQEMAQLIDDVLQLARVTRSEMRREVVSLSRLAHDVVAELAKRNPERTVRINIEAGLVIHGDKRLLRIMLTNLLGNAWKFTSNREAAEIAFGQSQTDGESSYFVRDNGAGFDMAYSDKLFRAFQRLHSGDEFEGTGIGLATVLRIINRHGGRVWAEGAVNHGATFYFTLLDLKERENGEQSDPVGGR